MPAEILNGDEIAAQLRAQLKVDILKLSQHSYRTPKLAVILVGENPASKIYIAKKKKACAEVGIAAVDFTLPKTTSQDELLALLKTLNDDPSIDGILVQLPLPEQISPAAVAENINPLKDVDGLHPYNVGCLVKGTPGLRPCTPAGVMLLLAHTGVNLIGKKAIVIGTSSIVGSPMIFELIHAGLTVTACNKNTVNLQAEIQRADADVLIVATGNPELIKGAWLKPGSIVIDVGINRLPNGKLIGDVEFDEAVKIAAWITPVPGGVGPMTIAGLLSNTLRAYLRKEFNASLEHCRANIFPSLGVNVVIATAFADSKKRKHDEALGESEQGPNQKLKCVAG